MFHDNREIIMRKFLGAAAVALIASPTFADPVVGMWRTHRSESTGGYLKIDVAKCGSKICGKIVAAIGKDNASDTGYEHLGKNLIWDMQPAGDGTYHSGVIWDPQKNKKYKSKMVHKGKTLSVSGCVFGICRAYDWKKIK